jgi:hypothetical protein
VQTGSLEQQVAAPYSVANLIGQFASGSSPPARLASVTVTGQDFFSGLGTVSATIDVASPCSLATSYPSNYTVTVSTAGRFEVQSGNDRHAGYMISPVRFMQVLERPSGDPVCDEVVHLYTADQ